MDPKQQLNNLDPKLQEAYDRVMGANVPPASPAQPVTPPQSTTPPTTTPQSNPLPESPAVPPKDPNDVLAMGATPSVSSTPPPASSNMTPMQSTVTTFISPAPAPTASTPHSSSTFVAGAGKSQEKSKISPPILIAGIVVFFMVYTLFWIKFFNIPVPFLPQ